MSAADDFLQDAGVAPTQQRLSAAQQFMQDASGAAPAPPPQQQRPAPEPLSAMDRLLAKVPTGLVNNPAVAGARSIVTNAAAPIMGGAQLIANAMPVASSVASAVLPNAVSKYLPDTQPTADLYNRKVAEMLRSERAAKTEQGPVVGAINEFAGAGISPMNVAIGGNAVPAVTAGARMVQGGAIGAAGGATAPVDVGESGKYFGQKAVQTGAAAIGGAVMAPVMGAIADRIASRVSKVSPENAAKEADSIITGALKESNQRLEDIPPDQLSQLRQKTTEMLTQGKRLDTAAALRMQDFKAERIAPTQGQITRDPMQFADEQTMKSMSRPLSMTMESGNKKVMQGITQYGSNAAESPVAATKLADALRNYDTQKGADVTTAYATARASAGKDLELPTKGLTDTYKQVLGDFEDKVPKAIQTKFAALESQPLTFEGADKLRKVINAHVGNDTTTNKALDLLRSSLNNAQKSAAASGGPFAPAVKLASDRFAEQEAIPALGAASRGDVGDNFVQKHVINGQTGDVQRLAALLKAQAPEAFQEARQQIGAELSRKAFGENMAGDKPVAQESYNRALNNFGTGKLNAFFEPEEVAQFKRLGRIGAYQQSNPAAAASNYSNTAGALANLLRSMPGGVPVASKSIQTIGEKLGGYAAIRPEVPVTPNLTDAQRLALSRALVGITGGASIALPSRVVGQ